MPVSRLNINYEHLESQCCLLWYHINFHEHARHFRNHDLCTQHSLQYTMLMTAAFPILLISIPENNRQHYLQINYQRNRKISFRSWKKPKYTSVPSNKTPGDTCSRLRAFILSDRITNSNKTNRCCSS